MTLQFFIFPKYNIKNIHYSQKIWYIIFKKIKCFKNKQISVKVFELIILGEIIYVKKK